MTAREFISAFNALGFVDRDAFYAAHTGIAPSVLAARYEAFQRDPARWLSRQDDATAARVWAIAQETQK